MMKRIVGWLVLVPLSVILILFALANRQLVTINFDPLSSDNPLVPGAGMPLFAVIYAMLLVGVVLGGIAVWFTQGHNRREKRQLKRENDRLTQELESARTALRQGAGGKGLLPVDDLLDID